LSYRADISSEHGPVPVIAVVIPMTNLRAIIFDFDGTLVTGTNAGYIRCYHAAAESVGYQLPFVVTQGRVLERWGTAPRIELASVLRETPELVDQAVCVYEGLLETPLFSEEVMPVPGVNRILEELRSAKILPVVISGMPKRLLKKFSKSYNFNFRDDELVSTIATDEPAKQKATGFHLRSMMNDNKWTSEEIFVVGDAKSDIQMADTQGVRTIAVLTGFLTESDAKALGAFTVANSVADLANIFREYGYNKAMDAASDRVIVCRGVD